MEEDKNVPVNPEEEEIEEEEEVEEPDESGEEEEGDDPYPDITDLNEAKKRLAKAEKAIVTHKTKKPKQPKQPVTKQQPDGDDDDLRASVKRLEQSDEKRQLGYERGLSPEQVDAVYRYTGGEKPDDQTLERPEVKAMIKSLQSKDRVAANTPKGGSGAVYKGKTFDEVMSDETSSPADKQAAFEGAKKKHGLT